MLSHIAPNQLTVLPFCVHNTAYLQIILCEMALDISQSLRGRELLVHHGSEYILRTKEPWMDDEKKYWRCRKYKTFKCKSSITTNGSNIIKEPSDHNHSGDSIQTDVHVALTKIKQDAKNTCATARQFSPPISFP